MYNKIVLDNGVKIITEKMDGIRSASLGIWVRNGSRYEPEGLNGISHFIEHMIFKGTTSRTASQIAKEMDSLGGAVNAFTSKDCTSYYLKTLDIYLDKGIEVLCDMFTNSLFEKKDVDLERSVIKEEVSMYEDSPEDLVVETLFSECFRDSALGMPILGTPASLDGITGEKMKEYLLGYYRPSDIVIAISGSFNEDNINLIKQKFQHLNAEGSNTFLPSQYKKCSVQKKKDIEQNHICIGFEGVPISSEKRHSMQVINSILGGSMSSRLFQIVREEHGLCYSISSFNSSYSDVGLFNVYTAVNKNMQDKALELIKTVILDFCKDGPTEDEVRRACEQIKTNMLMSLESSSSRMSNLGRSEICLGKILSIDEKIAIYDSIKRDELIDLSRQVFNLDYMSSCIVGT